MVMKVIVTLIMIIIIIIISLSSITLTLITLSLTLTLSLSPSPSLSLSLSLSLLLSLSLSLIKVVEFLHVKPGKGAAFVRSKLKNALTKNVVEKTFRAGEKIQTAELDKQVSERVTVTVTVTVRLEWNESDYDKL